MLLLNWGWIDGGRFKGDVGDGVKGRWYEE